jgi:hypothetical protein
MAGGLRSRGKTQVEVIDTGERRRAGSDRGGAGAEQCDEFTVHVVVAVAEDRA